MRVTSQPAAAATSTGKPAGVDQLLGPGAAFGTGAGDRMYITSDDGQFEAAVKAYYAMPAPLS